LKRSGLDIKAVPHDQTKRPGKVRKRVVQLGKQLCGVHHLRNVFQQPGRKAKYSRTCLHRASLDRQDKKIFVIAPPGYKEEILMLSTSELKRRFRPGQNQLTLYFPL